MLRTVQQAIDPLCTFRGESCDDLAVAELPLPESLSKGAIFTCERHFGEASANGYYAVRFDEQESTASHRCNGVTDARHVELRGSLELKFKPVEMLCDEWLKTEDGRAYREAHADLTEGELLKAFRRIRAA